MEKMVSSVTTSSPNTDLIQQARQRRDNYLAQTGGVSIGLVNNFDVDQRGFLTPPFKGMVGITLGQTGSMVGGLTMNMNYGKNFQDNWAASNTADVNAGYYGVLQTAEPDAWRFQSATPINAKPLILNKSGGLGGSVGTSYTAGNSAGGIEHRTFFYSDLFTFTIDYPVYNYVTD